MSRGGRGRLPDRSTPRSVNHASADATFAEQLLTVLAEGSFTATYKYGVLLAILDLCVEQSTQTGDAPTSITTWQLAKKVLELYWPQVRAYEERTLRQNSGKQARIVNLILRFQNQHGELAKSVSRARRGAREEFERLVREVEWTLIKMPLPRLQRVGSEQVRFLYEISWNDDIRRSTIDSGNFQNVILFIDNAGDDLVRLAPFVRPVVQREWARHVARQNKLPEAKLEQFLFGGRREAIAHLASPLLQLQDGHCFYCDKRILGKRQVDHFIPWSRHPDEGLDNLVVAHRSCNRYKSDYLAAVEHVERWAERTRHCDVELNEIANSATWQREPPRTLGIARSIYLRLPADARLWQIQREFVAVDAPRLRSVLGAVS